MSGHGDFVWLQSRERVGKPNRKGVRAFEHVLVCEQAPGLCIKVREYAIFDDSCRELPMYEGAQVRLVASGYSVGPVHVGVPVACAFARAIAAPLDWQIIDPMRSLEKQCAPEVYQILRPLFDAAAQQAKASEAAIVAEQKETDAASQLAAGAA